MLLTKILVNALVNASHYVDIACHLPAEKAMTQEAMPALLSQLPLLGITDTKKITVIHERMGKDKVDIEGLALVQ